jgi:hypothetical protein
MKKVASHARSHTQFMLQNMLPAYSMDTPIELLDPRCEYDVPRFFDLTDYDPRDDEPSTQEQDDFFRWFVCPHEFKINRRAVPKETLMKLMPQKHPKPPQAVDKYSKPQVH